MKVIQNTVEARWIRKCLKQERQIVDGEDDGIKQERQLNTGERVSDRIHRGT